MISASLSAHIRSHAIRHRQRYDSRSSNAHAANLETLSAFVAGIGDDDPRVKTIEAASRVLGAHRGVWQAGRHQSRVLGTDVYGQLDARPPQDLLADLVVAALEDLREHHAQQIAQRDGRITKQEERIRVLDARPYVDPATVTKLQDEVTRLTQDNRQLGGTIRELRDQLGHLASDPDSFLEQTFGTVETEPADDGPKVPEKVLAALQAYARNGRSSKRAADALAQPRTRAVSAP